MFVNIELLVGLSPNAKELNPDHPKIFKVLEDERRSKTGASAFFKITNPSATIIRDIDVNIHSENNYESTRQTYSLNIPRIEPNEYILVLLPNTFTSRPGSAYLVGMMDKKKVTAIESLKYVEAEFFSSKNEKLKVEANSNGRIKLFVNDEIVKAYDDVGTYTIGGINK